MSSQDSLSYAQREQDAANNLQQEIEREQAEINGLQQDINTKNQVVSSLQVKMEEHIKSAERIRQQASVEQQQEQQQQEHEKQVHEGGIIKKAVDEEIHRGLFG